MAKSYYNPKFTEQIPDGATGKQAYYAIFYLDDAGLFTRLTQAEGHEVALNPETEEKNTIGMLTARTLVKGYKIQFDKEIIIEKGELNYEFFDAFKNRMYTGEGARLTIMLVDMMKSVPGASGYQDCFALRLTMIVTVTTAGYTDAKLSVHFDQDGDAVTGLAQNQDGTEHPKFVPNREIPIAGMLLGKTAVTVKEKAEAWIPVTFEPFGCNDNFTVKVSSGADKCTAKRIRQSVVITGVKAGTAVVKVLSAADGQEMSINVTVGAYITNLAWNRWKSNGSGGTAVIDESQVMTLKPAGLLFMESDAVIVGPGEYVCIVARQPSGTLENLGVTLSDSTGRIVAGAWVAGNRLTNSWKTYVLRVIAGTYLIRISRLAAANVELSRCWAGSITGE